MSLYPATFQRAALSLAMLDKKYTAALVANAKPGYFETESMQWVFRIISEVFTTTREVLTDLIISTEISKLPPKEAGIYGGDMWALWNERASVPADYVRNATRDWLRRNIFVDSQREAADLYNNHGDFEAALSASLAGAQRATNLVIRPPDEAIYLVRDWAEVHKARDYELSKTHSNVSITGIEKVDEALDGGGRPEEFAAVLGLPKTKKSITLDYFTAVNFRLGLPVLVIKLEGRRQQNVDRLESILLQTAYHTVKHGKLDYGLRMQRKIQAEHYFGLSDIILRTLTSELRYTVLDVEEEIKAVRSTGLDPKLVIIDYCDLLYPADGEHYKSRYESQAQVFRETKILAERNHVMVWTAIQARRRTKKKDATGLLTEDDMADSYEKARVCDFIMTLNQVYGKQDDPNEPPKELPYVDWYIPICRDNPGSFKYRVFMDWDHMTIRDDRNANPQHWT